VPNLKLPALDPAAVEPRIGAGYPGALKAVCAGRAKRALTSALGLTQFGVNVTDIPPGGWSAQRHWHSHEDEFIFVLSGELTLITNDGRQHLVAGDCAGFPGGVPNGHHLVNESNVSARILEVGTRDDRDEGNYSDVDLHVPANHYKGGIVFTRRDGTAFER
jgi:uncharacterized cupin superfamily protein